MEHHSQLWRFTPLAAAAVALVASATWLGPESGFATAELSLLAALGIGAALYRPRGWPSLAMGACVLPLAVVTSGPVVATLLAVTVLGCRQVVGWLLEQEIGPLEGRKQKTRDLLLSVGPAALAVLVAGWLAGDLPAIETAPGTGPAPVDELTALGAFAGSGRMALAGAVYLTLFAGLTLTTRVGSEGYRAHWRSLRPFLLDAMGWAAGMALALIATHLGWPAVLALGAPLAVLSAAALGANVRVHRERAVSNRLRDVHLAGHRIIFRQPDLLAIATQICSECRDLVPFAWFHLELRDPEGRPRHWSAGPEGEVVEGAPEPPEHPRKAGLGRRPSWWIVTRNLSNGERLLGRIKLWCDPRRVAEGDLDWLDAFLPEISSAIERAFLSREARHDPLTDLPDRRVLENRLDEGFHRALALGSPMSVIMVDLDHFKLINDRHGHAIGDQALITVTRVLEEHRREADVCCRYGGEEFALVLEATEGETALAVAERIRRAVENTSFAPGGKPVPLRLSAGVASFPKLPIQNGRQLVEHADAALYEAKRQGRNRCLLNLGEAGFATAGARTPLSLAR